MNADALAQALRAAVLAQRFESTADRRQGGAPLGLHPSIDLAVAVFPRGGGAPVAANVLFSREHPGGLVARFDGSCGSVANIGFHADVRNAAGDSHAWLPGADWSRIDFPAWFGTGPRFVAPYPASLLKLMVAVGVARLVDAGRSDWALPLSHGGLCRPVADWLAEMIDVSSNDATTALVAHLHARGALRREGGAEVHNELQALFRTQGLPGLMLADTRPDGGWGNAAGAGVGRIQMTAWDALRLVWLLDADAPPPPWRPAGIAPWLSEASRAVIRRAMDAQQLNEILSSGRLAGLPGWVEGIPARFAHKTGTTENYASDAGIVHGDGGLHYLIAVTTSLGQRYRPHEQAATTWRLPALGGAVHAWIAAHC